MQLNKKFSPSLANYLNQCSLRFYYDSLELPQLPIYVPQADLGSEIHQIIKLYFQNIVDKPSSKQIRHIAEKTFEAVFTLTAQKAKAKRLLENFITFEIERLKSWKTYKPELIESKLELSSETCKTTFDLNLPEGMVTFVDFYGNKTLIDWKTGTIPYIDENTQFQLAFMKMLLEYNNHNVEKAYIVALQSGTVLELPRTTNGWVTNQIKHILNIIETEQFKPHRTRLCEGYCKYELRCEFNQQCLWM